MNTGTISTNISLNAWFENLSIAAIVPAYNVERELGDVLRSLPSFLRYIIVVDDASRDGTSEIAERFAAQNPRIILLRHTTNQGVGGAMVSGFRKALELKAQIAVKIDGDGQMSSDNLPALLLPLIFGEADYSKGNRFRDFQALRRMPLLRRMGNMGLSFFAKAAVGYWNCFDPTNGFVGIRGDVLAQLPLEKVHRSYFFETSMLSQLYLMDAVVKDVPMPAQYGGETSHLSIRRVLREFPLLLTFCLGRRILLKNFIYNLTMESIYLSCGIPMLLVGVFYGGINWIRYSHLGIVAPTGTVVIPAMLIILAFQLLLGALGLDLQAVPQDPICRGALGEHQGSAGPIHTSTERELALTTLAASN
jgi:dolichol-phosphate mannosyltransferase